MNIDISGLSHQGSRSHNEDSLFLPPQNNAMLQNKGYLFIVADGVGGHQAGEVASKMAIDIVSKTYYSDPNPDVRSSLQMAIEKANQGIFQEAKRNNDDRPRTMATTIAAAVLKGTELTVANVGDSRVYLISNGRVEQLTNDHSWVWEQMKAGILTAEQAKNHPQKNVVTRSLGHKLEVQVDVYPPRPIGPGHTILLCSDGLPAVIEDNDLAQIVTPGRSPNELTKRLVDLTLERGAPDNVTIIVVNFGAAAAAVAVPPTARTMSPSMAQVRPPVQQKSGVTLPLMLLLGAVALVILLISGITLAGVGAFWFNSSAPAPVAEAVIIQATMPITPTNTPLPVPTQAQTVESSRAENTPPPAAAEALTKTETLVVADEPPGSDPILLEPQDGATLSNNNADPIFLRWSGRELNAANQEQFVVSIRDGHGKNIVLTDKGIIQKAEYALPNDFKAGQYSWLVVVQKKKADGSGFEDVNRSKISSFTIRGASTASQSQPKIDDSTPPAMVNKRSAVSLANPTANQTFTGREAIIEFQWSEAFPALAADEYYVLIVNHREGEDRTWLKTNRYPLEEKRWFVDKGPDLFWQVVVAQKRTDDDNEDPRGAERSDYSEERKFIWSLPVNNSGGNKDDKNDPAPDGPTTGGGDGPTTGGGD